MDDKDNYLARIEAARVYDVAAETPLELAKNLTARLGPAKTCNAA